MGGCYKNKDLSTCSTLSDDLQRDCLEVVVVVQIIVTTLQKTRAKEAMIKSNLCKKWTTRVPWKGVTRHLVRPISVSRAASPLFSQQSGVYQSSNSHLSQRVKQLGERYVDVAFLLALNSVVLFDPTYAGIMLFFSAVMGYKSVQLRSKRKVVSKIHLKDKSLIIETADRTTEVIECKYIIMDHEDLFSKVVSYQGLLNVRTASDHKLSFVAPAIRDDRAAIDHVQAKIERVPFQSIYIVSDSKKVIKELRTMLDQLRTNSIE